MLLDVLLFEAAQVDALQADVDSYAVQAARVAHHVLRL